MVFILPGLPECKPNQIPLNPCINPVCEPGVGQHERRAVAARPQAPRQIGARLIWELP